MRHTTISPPCQPDAPDVRTDVVVVVVLVVVVVAAVVVVVIAERTICTSLLLIESPFPFVASTRYQYVPDPAILLATVESV